MKRALDYIGKNKQLLWVLYLPVYLILFFTVEHIVTPESQYWAVHTALDDVIPFCEYFAIPYYMWYLFLGSVGVYLMIKDKNAFSRYMMFIAVGFTSALLFGLIIPNGQDLRPDIASLGRDNVFTRLMSGIYAADTNTNVFPSMHVIGSAACVCGLFDTDTLRKRKYTLLKIASVILAVLICASTVFVKQHSVLDIYGGLAFSAVVYVIIYVFIKRKQNRQAAE